MLRAAVLDAPSGLIYQLYDYISHGIQGRINLAIASNVSQLFSYFLSLIKSDEYTDITPRDTRQYLTQ